MRRASSIAAVVAALVPGSLEAAPECRPAVIIAGDASTAAQIAEALHARGIDEPRAGCPAERARIDRVDGAIRLSITDSDGRRIERQVSDPDTAAAVIESFTALDLGPPIQVASADVEQPVLIGETIAAATSATPRGSFGAAFESALATDRSLWLGVRARGCVQLGQLCVGGAARFARDSGISGDAKRTASTRTTADMLVVLDVPLALGRFAITPGAGLGVGWLRGRANVSSGGEMLDVDAGGLRANAHVGVALPVGRGVSLTLGASVEVSPFAHTAPYGQDGHEIAGEPRGFVRLDLGLELVRR